jgi:two-component system chemotaxis response regulator CheY
MPLLETFGAKNPAIKSILLVEDDYSVREALQDTLEFEGYEVTTAVNGQEGLSKLRNMSKPCLVLLDMMMPIMGGRDFLDVVLADSLLAPIPVVVVSATAGEADTRGAKAVLKKPVDLDLLLKMVANFTAGPSGA